MNPIRHITGLGAIAERYDVLLCDAWGVIHDGRRAFDGVTEALTRFRKERGPVIILTNAPKPAQVIPPQLDRIGLPREAYDEVVTSGDVTRDQIRRLSPGRPFVIGWAGDGVLFEDLGIDAAPIEAADFIICTGLFENGPASPDDYTDLLRPAALRRVPMICANPDIVVRWQGALMWCAGAIAEVYEKLGGEVVYCGKPHPPIYQLALAVAPRGVDRRRILAIGDGARTDIAGANRAGIDAVLVAGRGGVFDDELNDVSIARTLSAAGAHAVGYMSSLVW